MLNFKSKITAFLTLLLIISSGLIFSFPPKVQAAINQSFTYQGKLLNKSTGVAITSSDAGCIVAGDNNDTCDFRASLYTALSGGTLVWQETKTDIEIDSNDSSFELTLDCSGTFSDCDQNGGPDFNTSALYIELEFAPAGASSFTETFSPRKQLSSVPYAFNADTVDGVSFDVSSPVSGNILIYDGTDSWDNKTLSGDATIDATGALTITNDILNFTKLSDSLSLDAATTITVTDTNKLTWTRTSSGLFQEFADGTDTFGLYNRAGTPEGNIAANIGSLALNTNNGQLYIKTTDTVNTGWNEVESTGGNSLGEAYTQGGSIITTDGKDIDITLSDTTNDSSFYIGIDNDAEGFFYISKWDGGTTMPPQLLLLENEDVDTAQLIGLNFNSAAGGLTTAIDATDTDITNALSFGTNTILGTTGNIDLTNFDVVGSTGNITTAGDIVVSGNVGIGDSTPEGNLDALLDQNLTETGAVCIDANDTFSDETDGVCDSSSLKVKTDIRDLSYGLDEILNLRPVFFRYKETFKPEFQYLRAGFIAEEMDEIVPEVVTYDRNGLPDGIDYGKLTAVLTNGIQEQQVQIENIVSLVGIPDDTPGLVIDPGSIPQTVLNRLTTLEDLVAELNQSGVLSESFIGLFVESAAANEVSQLISEKDLLMYTELSEVEKANYRLWKVVDRVVFTAKTRFLAAVEFVGKVSFGGRVIFADKDLAGLATIATKDTSVAVTFKNPYEIVPVVTATSQSSETGDFYVTNVTTRGFEIKLTSAQEQNVLLSWQALAVKDAQVFNNDGSVAGASSDPMFGRELVNPLAHEECFGYVVVRGFNDSDDERHMGVDLSKEGGCPVQAVAPGRVIRADWLDDKAGYVVMINHYDGVVSYSGHGQEGSIQVVVGDVVTTGQKLMQMGDTGETTGVHLHLGLIVNGEATDPAGYVEYQSNDQLIPTLLIKDELHEAENASESADKPPVIL